MAARTATGVATRGRTRKKKNPVVRWIKRIILLFLTAFCIAFTVAFAVFFSNYKEAKAKLDNLPALMAGLQRQPTIIYSADGEKLYIISAEYRRPVESKDIPKVVKDALIAAEDVRFYKHKGVDPQSLARIAVEAMREKRFSQGGSTLTMQLAKRLYTSPERTIKRKIQDMALAVAMEEKLTKDQIITLYLNQVFYGNNAYGIRAAAEVYLGKEIKYLDASDAALLVRCVRRPSSETPFANYKKAVENRDVVLKIMHDEGMITTEVYEHSLRQVPKLNPKPPSTTARLLKAPYFVDHVLDTIRQDMPEIDVMAGGYKIFTTLDSRIQSVAEKAVKKTVDSYRKSKVTTGACILIDYKGRILAEVGGYDYKTNQFNAVLNGKRQPGSAFKSFLYAAAIDRDIIDENSSVSNALKTYRDQWGTEWTPKNDRNDYGGYKSIRTAFSLSYNVCAAHLMEELGPQVLVDYCHNVFGFTSHLNPYPSLSLGAAEVTPLEMARGYSVFMTGGDRVEPYPVDRIVGQDGQVIRKYEPRIAQNVLSPRVVNQMRNLQLAVVQSGTATRVVKGKVANARGKTGTTSDNKDAWFCGYSDGLACITWVANEQRVGRQWRALPMHSRVFGGTVASQIWVPTMQAAYKKYAVPQPDRGVGTRDSAPSPFANNPSNEQREPSEAENVDEMVAPRNDNENENADENGNGITDAPEDPSSNPQPDDLPPVEPIKPIEQPKPKPPPKKIEYIDKEICASSYALATMYCPETVMRTYQRGQEPKNSCPIHRPH